jgi:tRNA (guanine26-N2/guanine27-N2)-dimethyltransferase
MIKTQLVKEGLVELEVPELSSYKTPSGDYAPSLAPVFYNPHMELSRDLSVLACAVFARNRQIEVCDPMAGVGVRGIRYAKEVESVSLAVLNDRSPLAQEFLRKNVEINKLQNVKITKEDANVLLSSNKFDLVDLDPFGSPSPFLDSACRSLRPHALLLITATDTAPLCGRGERACIRKYSAKPLRTEYCREIGLRILIGFAQRTAAKFGIALSPVFSHATRHYFRVGFLAQRSRRLTDELLRQQGVVSHCFACGRRKIYKSWFGVQEVCVCGNHLQHAGPMWLGELGKRDFLSEMSRELERRSFRRTVEERKLLQLLSSEVEGPPTFYSIHKLCGRMRTSPPKLERIIEGLRKMGFQASRTHFSPDGVRTNAPFETLCEVIA